MKLFSAIGFYLIVESGLCFGTTIPGERSIKKGDKWVSRISYIHDMSFNRSITLNLILTLEEEVLKKR